MGPIPVEEILDEMVTVCETVSEYFPETVPGTLADAEPMFEADTVRVMGAATDGAASMVTEDTSEGEDMAETELMLLLAEGVLDTIEEDVTVTDCESRLLGEPSCDPEGEREGVFELLAEREGDVETETDTEIRDVKEDSGLTVQFVDGVTLFFAVLEDVVVTEILRDDKGEALLDGNFVEVASFETSVELVGEFELERDASGEAETDDDIDIVLVPNVDAVMRGEADELIETDRDTVGEPERDGEPE